MMCVSCRLVGIWAGAIAVAHHRPRACDGRPKHDSAAEALVARRPSLLQKRRAVLVGHGVERLDVRMAAQVQPYSCAHGPMWGLLSAALRG